MLEASDIKQCYQILVLNAKKYTNNAQEYLDTGSCQIFEVYEDCVKKHMDSNGIEDPYKLLG